ncbi:2,4-dienoyl-CoA reductase [Anaerobacillus alkalidiazotrophicus]|uniref:2,4-dienoyl-CoA reductase n=1 Tax=Anaerobacillus alkalidiazotrophicus TaxID=472963 RepID=A0A1S2M460_9BACI|nr:FAD-dependent oxidoreductase [Anaerobacillus alkalidiazotrophicus]OIJ19253.1 2,4-dienoyl-CoA reductase [Anaerobacillus alkalidiazotrophicus]
MLKMLGKANIGKMKLRNRVFMAPMGTTTDPDGGYSDRNIHYFTARAKGGIGLIITGANTVTDKYEPRPCHLLDHFNKVGRLNLLIERAHQYGAKVCVQLSPGLGRVSFVDPFTPPYAPSPVPAFWFPSLTCKPFTIEDIQYLIKAFGYSASLAKQAGADAIEIHGYGGYLIDQFHSTLWNKRTDEYGGDLEGRTRFSRELITEVQKTCGKDFPIIFKFTPYHGVEDGRELEEGIEIAKILESAGVAALHVDKGCYEAWYHAISTVYEEKGAQISLAHSIKKAVKIPVLAQGKLSEPAFAEQVLQEGKTDFVGLGHQLLADPEWVNKVADGKIDDIIPCIGCNECLLGGFSGKNTTCALNPTCGYESEYKLEEAKKTKSILVVGGGPGGMTAAISAAKRGFKVELWEKKDHLGGNLLAAGAPSFKKDVINYTDYLKTQVSKHPINLKLLKEGSVTDIINRKDDLVILALGAKEATPPIPGIDKAHVKYANNVLLGKEITGDEVVVIGGGLVGCETALFLKQQGKEVTIVEMLDDILQKDSHSLNNTMKLRSLLAENGITIKTKTQVESICYTNVTLKTNENEELFDCDSVVIATGYLPESDLVSALEDKVPLASVGDCVRPGKILDAVHEAFHTIRLQNS